MTPYRFRHMVEVRDEAILFTDLDSFLVINDWMKERGDTCALANENRYMTPIMLINSYAGTAAANPGDWIVRDQSGQFIVVPKAEFYAEYKW